MISRPSNESTFISIQHSIMWNHCRGNEEMPLRLLYLDGMVLASAGSSICFDLVKFYIRCSSWQNPQREWNRIGDLGEPMCYSSIKLSKAFWKAFVLYICCIREGLVCLWQCHTFCTYYSTVIRIWMLNWLNIACLSSHTLKDFVHSKK